MIPLTWTAGMVEGLTVTDSKGKKTLSVSTTVQLLESQRKFITGSGINNLYVYEKESGSWKAEAVEFIRCTLERNVREYIKTNTVNELIDHITRKEYVDPGMFNKKVGLINLKNGVYDINDRSLMEHDPDFLFTYCLPFEYKAEAKPDKFMAFLNDICDCDLRQMISIIEGFAYTFIPEYPIQKANMLVGQGANGKGTLLNVLKKFAGEENCEHLTIQTISKMSGFALPRLQGKLLNIGPDLPSKELPDAGNFKALTGGDTLSAEVKYVQSPVHLKNSAKLWFSANQIPQSPEDTIAFYRRWNVWQFKKQFPEGRDILPELTTEEELAGIFNVVIEAYRVMMANLHYTFTADIELTRENYLKSADTVQVFADKWLSYDPDSSMPKTSVIEAYIKFCKTNNLIAIPENAFWRSLKKKIVYDEHRVEREAPCIFSGRPSNPLIRK